MSARKTVNVGGREPVAYLILPFQRFVQAEASGGVVLLAAAALALVWANSPWADLYFGVWATKLTVGIGGAALSKPLSLWINDGLMAVFFFVVGLEIKREALVGELAEPRKAALPAGAALGGMVVPAAIYAFINAGGPGTAGWGIPMATDIAFALGILALIGPRVPISLKVFLTAVAIVDDIGAVIVIALFYTSNLAWLALLVAGVCLVLLVLANWAGVRSPLVYLILGCCMWLAFLKSGVHATVAGVLAAMTIPARTRIDAPAFLSRARAYLQEFETSSASGRSILSDERQRAALVNLEFASREAESPLQRLEHSLHPWVSFAIMPLFALANAGVSLGGAVAGSAVDPITLGVAAGLVLGKPLGVTLGGWLLVRAKLAAMPTGVSWRQMIGVGCLAGVGFTMSLFIANLAFGATALNSAAKLGILAGSLISGLVGFLILKTSAFSGEGGK